MADFKQIADSVGELVAAKNAAYGDSVTKTAKILENLYPNGVLPSQYGDLLLIVRILDKLSRLAQRVDGKLDPMNESPYNDISGYGILGIAKDQGK